MVRRILVILAIGVVLLVLGERYGPGGAQRRGMREMDALRERVEPRLAANARFRAVRMTVTTHPGLRVHGDVADAHCLSDLRSMVEAEHGVPPEVKDRVIWDVVVRSDPATQQAAR